jgi:1,4-dihydroxy-2-naphthoate octaprenyltransferase
LTKLAAWINAARLRTLPLSISGVLVGTALANFYEKNNILIFVLALLTTIGFQVTSNFANDYGDGVKGTDNDDRIGPKRALQSGILTRKELKNGIVLSILICLFLVATLLYFAFGLENIEYFGLFGVLGFLSIWAAIKYTVGNSAYGYKGLGDIFVFLFFGLLAVLGTLFLYTKFITTSAWLPALAIGALSTGVLNLNNLRDIESDKKANKNTMVVKMGFKNGKRYHFALLLLAFASILTFILLNANAWYNYIPLLAFVPIAIHAIKIFKIEQPKLIDPELKKLALSTFLMALLLYITLIN